MFKSYVLATSSRGMEVYPAEAFQPLVDRRDCSAFLIESLEAEEAFRLFKPYYTWTIRLAHKRGYGL